MNKERSLKTLPLDGGTVAFHFINTVYTWKGENLHEYLNNYTEVLEWCSKVKILSPKILQGLKGFAALHPRKEKETFVRIQEARHLLYRFFSGVAGKRLDPLLLKDFNQLLPETFAACNWVERSSNFSFVLREDATDLLLPLRAVLKDAYDVLLERDTRHIKECPRCGWIFLDDTKNNKRRWCNPATCGSVEKAKKYYQRVRKDKGA